VRTGTPDWFESNADYAARYPQSAGKIVPSDVTQAVASIPLIVNGVTIGGLGISFTEPRTFDESERFFVLTLARQCAQALDRARLYEEAQEANRSKDEFLSVLSHELRTPLNAILGWASILLAKGGDAATVSRGIQVIERNARAQVRIIEDILDVSRIITGKLRLERRPLDVVSVVKASVEVLRPMADAKQVDVSCDLSAALPLILGDADRLQQVAWNLLSNAIKFTPKGGRIELKVEGSGSSVMLRVSDTGPGISADFLPFVFERFRQADSSSSRAHGGLGLGLAIVRHIVEMHGGSVAVESPGALAREGAPGATFTVSLPLLEFDEEDGGPAGARISFTELDPASGPRDLRGLRVLVVDDEADARELMLRVLREGGADARAAGSAVEALEELDAFRPDVLVSDIGMPGEDGLSLLRKVRSLGPPLGRVPAVALTAYARPEDAKKAFLAGFQMHVSKPIEPASLMAVVANLGGRVSLDL
jgi:signal transduction histidine kinase